MKLRHIVTACAVLGLACAWLAARHASRAAPSARLASREASAAELDLAPTGAESANALDGMADTAASPDESARTAVAPEAATPQRATTLSPDGAIARLILRAVDATTLEPLRALDVRLASQTRFAAEHSPDSGGELELKLTPDTYSLVVSARGYEARELEPASVAAGETKRLEPVALQRGTGSLAVLVVGAVAAEQHSSIELAGAGRRPCAQCSDTDDALASEDAAARSARAWERASPCPWCGFMKERSRLPLDTRSSCAFEGLASGGYALRLTDAHGLAASEPCAVVLNEGERALITLDLSDRRYVELEFVDVDGRSLTEEWRRRLAYRGEDDEDVGSENVVRSVPIALRFFDEISDPIATASFQQPPPPRGSVIGTIAGRAMRRPVRKGERTTSTTDRARAPGDEPWPPPATVSFPPTPVSCEFEDSGLVRVGTLPGSRLELHVSAAHFAADAIVPASRERTRVTVKLKPTPADPGAAPEPATYLACESTSGH